MSRLDQIKQHLDRLKQLFSGMKERLRGRVDSLRPELEERLKKEGMRLGIGSGLILFGLAVLGVGAIYLVAALMLTLNLALERLWLSALIVVGALLLLGGLVAAVGASVARSSGKRMKELTEGANQNAVAAAREIAEEVQKEVRELQELLQEEAEERRAQALRALEALRRLAPALAALLLLFAFIRRRRRRKRALKQAGAPVLIREVIREEE